MSGQFTLFSLTPKHPKTSQNNIKTHQQPRHDKYEGKPLYWIEEEVEVEYEKTSSKSHSEQAEYTVASTAEDVLLSSLDGVSLEMGSVAGGGTMKTLVGVCIV